MLDMILRWFARRQPDTPASAPVAPPARARAPVAYPSFYGYLEKRYADLVVLTFGQIEDLLGSALPEQARTHAEWWTTSVPSTTRYSDAWRLAGRTAKPNLLAGNVAFERIVTPAHGLTSLPAMGSS